jgi:hypothetical protein
MSISTVFTFFLQTPLQDLLQPRAWLKSVGATNNIARFDNLHNRVALLETGTGLDQEHKTPGRVVFSNLYLTFS